MLLIILTELAFIATPIHGFCSANITSIPASTTRAGLTDPPELYELVRYTPLRQIRPTPFADPEHLFNLIYDHREPDCLQVKLERYSGKSSLSIMPDCQGPVGTIEGIVALSLRQVDRCDQASSSSCYECSNETVRIARHFKGFAREQLRLTFLYGRDLLLVEDLSDRVPKGLWMMLRKDTKRYKTCKCEWFKKFARRFDVLYGKVNAGNYLDVGGGSEEKSIVPLLVWIGGSISVPIVVVIVCLCLKMLF